MYPMTTGQLIEILKAFPPLTPVFSQADTGQSNFAEVAVNTDDDAEDYYGGTTVRSAEEVAAALKGKPDKPLACWIVSS